MIDPSQRLRRAIHSDDVLLVTRILKNHPRLLHNPDLSKPDGRSNTSLHLASSLGRGAIAQFLLDAGHERDGLTLNEDHQTALMLAAGIGHVEVTRLLCSKLSKIDSENGAGNVAIGNSSGSFVARKDIRGRDAIMEASRNGHDTCVQILLSYGESSPSGSFLLDSADNDGNTALHFASSHGHLLVLRTLLAAGADPDRRNVWSWTPVAYSATVQAEVFFKGLAAEQERRKAIKRNAIEKGTGGAVRVVAGTT